MRSLVPRSSIKDSFFSSFLVSGHAGALHKTIKLHFSLWLPLDRIALPCTTAKCGTLSHVCLSVSVSPVSVWSSSRPRILQNGWTDRYAVQVVDSCGQDPRIARTVAIIRSTAWIRVSVEHRGRHKSSFTRCICGALRWRASRATMPQYTASWRIC